MAKFHITPNGKVLKCTANTRACPIGGNHFSSAEEAQQAFEATMVDKAHATLDKAPDPLDSIKRRDYSVPTMNALPLKDKLRVLLRDHTNDGQQIPAELKLIALPAVNDRIDGDLYYSEKSGRLVRWNASYDSADNVFSNRTIKNLGDFKKIDGVAFDGYKLRTDPEEIAKTNVEGAELRAKRLKDREKYQADSELRRLYAMNPQSLSYGNAHTGLSRDDFSTVGPLGSGVLNSYDLDDYNETITSIRDSDSSAESKASAIIAERKKLLSVLIENVSHNSPKGDTEDLAYKTWDKIKSVVLVGRFRREHQEELAREQKNEENLMKLKRESTMVFARSLISAPYYTQLR